MKAPASTLPQWSYRMAVMSRTIAAIVGGYGVACLAAAGLAVSLPLSRSDAVMAAQMLSFVVYTCAVLWVFATRSAWRAWGGLIGLSVVFGLMFAWGRVLAGAA